MFLLVNFSFKLYMYGHRVSVLLLKESHSVSKSETDELQVICPHLSAR